MTPEPANPRDMVLVSDQSHMALIEDIELQRSRERTIAKIRLLWDQRRFLGKVLLYGAAASLLLAFLIPSKYESTVELMPPDQQSSGLLGALAGAAESSGLGSSLGSSLAGEALGLKTSSDLFIGVLQSRTVQDDLINKFDLRKVYWVRKMEDARKDLAKQTSISVDRKSGIITIKITDHSPQRAAAMGREYIEQLNWVMANLNTSAAHRERVFLEERLKQVSQDLEVAEKKLSEFSSKNATLDMKGQGLTMVQAAAAIEGQLIASQTELRGLKEIYSDNNVRVRSVQARIDELRRQLQRVGGKTETGGGTGTDGQYVDSLYPTIRELPLLGVSYADLDRETRVEAATFEMLTREYESAKVEEVKELPSVKVLDQPDVPGKRSFPPRSLMVCLGTFLAALIGALFVFGSESWRAIDPQDPGKMLATEVWVQVKEHSPWVSTNGSLGTIASRSRSNRADG